MRTGYKKSSYDYIITNIYNRNYGYYHSSIMVYIIIERLVEFRLIKCIIIYE